MEAFGHQPGKAERDSNERAKEGPEIGSGVTTQLPHVRLDVAEIAGNCLRKSFQLCNARFHAVECAAAIAGFQGRRLDARKRNLAQRMDQLQARFLCHSVTTSLA